MQDIIALEVPAAVSENGFSGDELAVSTRKLLEQERMLGRCLKRGVKIDHINLNVSKRFKHCEHEAACAAAQIKYPCQLLLSAPHHTNHQLESLVPMGNIVFLHPIPPLDPLLPIDFVREIDIT